MGATGLEAGRLGAGTFSRLRGGPVLLPVPAAAGSGPSSAQGPPVFRAAGGPPSGPASGSPSLWVWRGNPLCSESLRHPTGPPGYHRPSLRLQTLHLSTSAKSLSPCKVTHVHLGIRGSLAGGAYSVCHDPLKKKKQHDLTPRVFKELLLGA